jgi:Arc/MetJ family transcription regulator
VYEEVYMRTNIVLDDALVKEAFRHASVKTKRELVDLALREFVATRKRRDLRELVGKVKLDPSYDYKKARIG